MDIKIFSKILFLVCLFYISCNGLQAQSAIPPFRKGERVVSRQFTIPYEAKKTNNNNNNNSNECKVYRF